jgi:hypothetical protein
MRMADGSELRILGIINLPLFIDNQGFCCSSDTLISLKGTTSFASEHKDLATKIPLFFSVSVVESIAKLVPLG